MIVTINPDKENHKQNAEILEKGLKAIRVKNFSLRERKKQLGALSIKTQNG